MSAGKQMTFNGPGRPMQLLETSVPELKEGEVLIKNIFTTICGSDLHTYCGKRKEACPTILGHEIVGEVIQVAPGHPGVDYRQSPLSPGTLVTWTIFSSDPQSGNSLKGMPQKGDDLFKYGHALLTGQDVFHGGLSEYCILKHGTCILTIPSTVPIPVAATINCAIATVAGSLRMAGELQHKNVLIFGMGLLGLTCAAMCREAGAATIMAADIDAKRLEEAMKFGVDDTILFDPGNNSSINDIREKFSMKEADIVFDMSGSPDAMEAGLDVLSIGGTAVWIGAVFNTRKLQIDPEKIIRRILTIKGLHNYNYDDFVYALDFIEANWEKYRFDQVIEKEFSLEKANEAFEYALTHKPLRVGVRI